MTFSAKIKVLDLAEMVSSASARTPLPHAPGVGMTVVNKLPQSNKIGPIGLSNKIIVFLVLDQLIKQKQLINNIQAELFMLVVVLPQTPSKKC